MQRTKISLKALEVFLCVARRGAVTEAAEVLGISVSTASHHLSELERTAGMALFDHARRPMQLTPAGDVLYRRVDEAMGSLRRGLSEIWSDDLHALVRHLRIGLIEDFDADVGPALAERLLPAAPNCDLSLLSRPTHELLELLQTEQIDIGVATSTDFDRHGLVETPILRDPFVLVVPAEGGFAPAHPSDLMAAETALPFLRYSGRQLLGRRIEMQLRRMGLHFARRMEFETTHVILSLVAESHGWTITTMLSFARAQRTHARLRVLPFPGSAFARRISMYSRTDLPHAVAELALGTIRHAIARKVLDPTCSRYPWLSDQFHLLPETEADGAREPAVR